MCKLDNLISIIVPVYNIDKYLEKCIESIIHQTYKNIEIILVDDGSTDGSALICDKYAKKDKRIVVIHKENAGLVSARKCGLDHARGDYVMNVDGDDWIDGNMCETLLAKALETGSDVIDVTFSSIDPNGAIKRYAYEENFYQLSEENRILLLGYWLKNAINIKIHSTLFSKLFKKEIFEQIYSSVPDNMSYGEDMIAFINLLSVARSIYVTGQSLYFYRIRESSVSHGFTKKIFKQSNKLDEYLYALIGELFPMVDLEELDEWYISRKRWIVNRNDYKKEYDSSVYLIPNVEEISGDIILYGAGRVGNDYFKQLSLYSKVNIVAWVDNEYQNYHYRYCDVCSVQKCIDGEYDFILIAVAKKEVADEIEEGLKEFGIDEKKIVWIQPKKRKIKVMVEDENGEYCGNSDFTLFECGGIH